MTPVLLRRARSMAQVPVRYRPKSTPGGHSFLSLLGIALDYYLVTATRPFLIGALIAAGGFAAGLVLLLTGPRLLGLCIAAFSLLAALLALVGEYAQRLYQLAQGIPFYQLRDAAPQEGRREDTLQQGRPRQVAAQEDLRRDVAAR
jgi:hypothetical protein